jgi:hypothetical protein
MHDILPFSECRHIIRGYKDTSQFLSTSPSTTQQYKASTPPDHQQLKTISTMQLSMILSAFMFSAAASAVGKPLFSDSEAYPHLFKWQLLSNR